MTFKEKITLSLPYQTLQYIKKKPSFFLITMLYDLFFLVALFLFNKFQKVIFPQQFGVSTFGFLIIILILLVFLIVIYTVLKYMLLQIIDSFDKKLLINFRNIHFLALFHFFFFGLSFLFLIIINYAIKTNVKQQFITTMQYIIFIPLIIILYHFLTLMQNYFLQTLSIKESCKNTLQAFSRKQSYIPLFYVVFFNLILIIILTIVLALINNFYLEQHQIYSLYVRVSLILFIIFFIINYIYFAFTRVSYNLVSKK